MSKMSEAATVIEDLRKCAGVLTETADWLASFLSSEPEQETAQVQSPKPTLTLEAVRAVLAEKSRDGHTAEIRVLLQRHGAPKLSEIDPVEYSAILAEAEAMNDATE